MNSVDLSPLNKNDTEFQKAVTELSGKYRCEWNDSVHDSFLPFVRTMEEHSQTLHRISGKAESILSEVEQINMDELCAMADNLVREAESILSEVEQINMDELCSTADNLVSEADSV